MVIWVLFRWCFGVIHFLPYISILFSNQDHLNIFISFLILAFSFKLNFKYIGVFSVSYGAENVHYLVVVPRCSSFVCDMGIKSCLITLLHVTGCFGFMKTSSCIDVEFYMDSGLFRV